MLNEVMALDQRRVGLVLQSRKHGDRLAVIDAVDYPTAREARWYPWLHGRTFYAVTNRKRPDGRRTTMFLHHVVLGSTAEVDHINWDGLDNTRVNLRHASRRTNTLNRRTPRSNTSGFRGVSRISRDRVFRARIGNAGKLVHLGDFSTPEAAARAYDKAARELHGDLAQLNFTEAL